MLRSFPRGTAAWLRAIGEFVFIVALSGSLARAGSVTNCSDNGDAGSLRAIVAAVLRRRRPHIRYRIGESARRRRKVWIIAV